MEKRVYHQLKGFLSTPPLWKDRELFGLEQFNAMDFNPGEDFSVASEYPGISSTFVLGKRAEIFFQILLNRTKNWQILTANLQIQKEKITLGEIDFLLRDRSSGKLLQVELAYKFYIFDPSLPTEAEAWIGPNRRDTLLQKIQKLKEKQFPLLYKPETEKYLDKLNLKPADIRQQVCFKAQLFVPKMMTDHNFKHINSDCIAGFWIGFKEFSEQQTDSLFLIPEKQDWPVSPRHGNKWLPLSTITLQISGKMAEKRSPLVWEKKSNGSFQRCFVVWW